MRIFCSILFGLLLLLPTLGSASIVTEEKHKIIHESVKTAFPDNGAGAIVWIAQGNKTLYRQAYGQSVIEFNVPMRTDTPFHLGSLTKQFTATAILMLQERGKLSVNDRVDQYFPDFPALKKHPVLIKHLLTHTGGIPANDGLNGYSHHGTEKESFDVKYSSFKNEPLDFEPGTQVYYSNNGYIMLGRIVELVTGDTYKNFIMSQIFKPLGMTQSRFDNPFDVIAGLSQGYEIEQQSPFNIIHGKNVKPSQWGDGGIISTLDDMQKWLTAIKNNTLLNSGSLQQMFKPYHLINGLDTKHAMGWKVAKIGNYQTHEHGGNNHGFENYLMMIPEKDLVVLVATNLNRSYPGELAEKIVSILLDIPDKKDVSLQLSNAHLDRYLGAYEYNDGVVRAIVREGDFLYSVKEDGSKNKLIAFGENKFYFEQAPTYWLRFDKEKGSEQYIMYAENRASVALVAKYKNE